ncbi:MAG: hypothetical protein HUJ75_05655, partial [Parasporobacterium sp.]|nr:hypothetical protein [Parasporobacterium sp.]
DPCQWSFEDELEGNLCMVTHEHLDNFSGAHGYMSHCWTAEDYPETAKENFWSDRQWEEYEYTTYFTVDPDYDTSWYDNDEEADIHPQGEYVEPAPEEQPPAEQPPAEQPQPGADTPAPSGNSTPGGNAPSGDTGNTQPDNSNTSDGGNTAPDTGASGGDSNTSPDGADAGAAPVSDQGSPAAADPDPAA